MKAIKPFVSTVLSLTLVLCLLPLQALQAFATEFDDPPQIEVTTGIADCISSSSVAITLSSFDVGSLEGAVEFGVEIATVDDFTDVARHTSNGSASLFFINGLTAETDYYYRSYLCDEDESYYYGAAESFTTPAEQADGTVHESRRAIISEITYINTLLEPFGVDVGQFASLPEKDPGFYEELAAYANISNLDGLLDFSSMPTAQSVSQNTSTTSPLGGQTSSMSVRSPSTTSSSLSGNAARILAPQNDADLFAARLEYALDIAQVNMNRDPDAGSVEDETVYMFLSHYIDMQPGDVGTVPSVNSGNPKFSAWITYIDREVYDNYLNVSGFFTIADNMRAAAIGIVNLGTSTAVLGAAASALNTTKGIVRTIVEAINTGVTVYQEQDVGEAIVSIIEGINGDRDPEEIIEDVYDALDGADYGKATKDYIVSSGLSLVLSVGFGIASSPAIGGPAVRAAILAVNLISMGYFEIYQSVAWLGMELSLSGRLPGRMLRYYGMW
jgi:hypothetical protein